MQKIMQKKYLIIITIAIFILALGVRYYPVFHKGYSCNIDTTNLILARNLSLIGEYKIVDEKDIVLSSSLIKKRGADSNAGNGLTPILYSKVFDIFGFNRNSPLYISLLLYSFITVLLFLLILKLFNFKIALIFVGIDILIPFVLAAAIHPGFYEWATLFFIIAILIYLWKKPGIGRLLLSGLFFGLAVLARNAFLISFIPFVVYDWYTNFIYKKDWRKFKLWLWPAIKRVFIFALPVILLWGGFMIQDYLGGRANRYLSQGDVGYDGHLFRDPYTYHFNKDNYIEEIQDSANGETITYLKAYDYDITWKQHLAMYFYSIKYYLNSFFRQPTIGGPLIIFFLILGVIYLFKFRKSLLNLLILWIGILFFILIFVFKTSNEAHFLEVRFPLILLISIGIYWTLKWLSEVIKDKKTYYLLITGLLLVLFVHLFQSDKWMFHENYLYSGIEEKVNLVDTIKKSTVNIGTDDVIAISKDPLFLNYYTDYNYIYFNPETIKELLKENKLQWAFDQFGVTKIIGYNNTLTQEIIQNTKVKTIVGLSLED